MTFRLENIKFGFQSQRMILDGISLNLEKNKIYALMGANGSGKTTIFNLISGFLKPESGNIFFNSKKISGMLPYKINRLGIGRTFQDLRLISKLTVKENILLAMQDNPTQNWYKSILPVAFYKSEIKVLEKEAEAIISTCFLHDVRHSSAGEISYGQQKLLSLACCIANKAKVILLDEPIAGINPRYRAHILDLLKKFKAEEKTIFLIEHNTEFIQQIADHFFFLKSGQIKEHETFAQLKNDKEVLEAYLSA